MASTLTTLATTGVMNMVNWDGTRPTGDAIGVF
jgi:hypothetical protein